MPLKPILVLTWDILMVITIKIRTTNGKENCTFVFESRNAKFGNFSSPTWPSKYPNNMRCIYYFRGEPFETINITFLVFDLESPFPKGCLSDYIDISTITAFNVKRLVGRYCGSSVPSPLLSMHPRSEIIFKSNHVISRPGFFGFYEFLDESLIGPPLSTINKECGGEEKGFGGVINSPNYPNAFPKQIDCMWLIRVEQHQHIYLRIMQLQLFGSIANCKDAHLAVYDGYENYDYEHHEPKKYCGDLKYYKSLDDKVQLSANNRLLIRFKSDISAPQWEEQVSSQEITGFKIIWTAVTFKPKGQCKDFLCSKSEFCLTPNSGSTCKRKEYFCIDKSLKCDGTPHCSEQDSSDEDQCNVSYRLYIISSLIGTSLIVLMLTCFICHRKRKYHQSLQSGLHGSQSSAFTLKTTSDGSISVKHLNHSPQSSSLMIDQATGPELLLPLETYYHSSEKETFFPSKSSSGSKMKRSTAPASPPTVHYPTGSLRTPKHMGNSHKQNPLLSGKPVSSPSLGNIASSCSSTSLIPGKVKPCSIHGHGSNLFQVPPSLCPSHQNLYTSHVISNTLGTSRELKTNNTISLVNLKS